MTFGKAIKDFWTNYTQFRTRTSRAGFWWAVLFLFLASIAVSMAFSGQYVTERIWDGLEVTDYKESAIENLWALATLLPSIAITVRRLHDMGRSGKSFWWLLLPIAGPIMILIWCLKPGESEANTWGEPVE